MANAVATNVRAFKNGPSTLMARVVGADDAVITQADVSSITYTISALDPNDPDSETVVDGHEDVDVTVADAVFDSLQTDSRWNPDIDATGYNFLHEVDVSSNQAFTVRGTFYLVRFSFTPASGQVYPVEFKVKCG